VITPVVISEPNKGISPLPSLVKPRMRLAIPIKNKKRVINLNEQW
jgi:hypothetical protein